MPVPAGTSRRPERPLLRWADEAATSSVNDPLKSRMIWGVAAAAGRHANASKTLKQWDNLTAMGNLKEKVSPCAIVIIGAGGDLGKLKLMPALAQLENKGWLPDDYRILVTSRRAVDAAEFIASLMTNVTTPNAAAFRERIIVVDNYDPGAQEPNSTLAQALNQLPYQQRLFYAATPPSQFPLIAASLARDNLLLDDSPLILEKPLGNSLAGYQAINKEVSHHLPEDLIYRIDHYLGKETVQNILCMRFANLIFESLWNRNYIDHVQITVAETVGTAGRGGYYEAAGALRDMVQNHMAQLLCLVAMEQPRAYEPDCVRDEKLKVLQSLAPLTAQDVVVGQYVSGLVNDEKVAAYTDDVDNAASTTETFAALRVNINNWRWAGVPFFLRTGKRLPKRESLIVVRFKPIPHTLFDGGEQLNQIVIRLQPDEGVELLVNNKIPGPGGLRLEPNVLNLNFTQESGAPMPDAYERLLLDALRQNATLYMRHDEVESSWQWIERILDGRRPKVEPYAAGTWGPDNAQFLLAESGRRWVNPKNNN